MNPVALRSSFKYVYYLTNVFVLCAQRHLDRTTLFIPRHRSYATCWWCSWIPPICGLAESFERLRGVYLLRLSISGVPDASITIGVVVLSAVDDFLKFCNSFDCILFRSSVHFNDCRRLPCVVVALKDSTWRDKNLPLKLAPVVWYKVFWYAVSSVNVQNDWIIQKITRNHFMWNRLRITNCLIDS